MMNLVYQPAKYRLLSDSVTFKTDHLKFKTEGGEMVPDHLKFITGCGEMLPDHLKFKTEGGEMLPDHLKFKTEGGEMLPDHCMLDLSNRKDIIYSFKILNFSFDPSKSLPNSEQYLPFNPLLSSPPSAPLEGLGEVNRGNKYLHHYIVGITYKSGSVSKSGLE